MKERTQHFTSRLYPTDVARLHQLHEQLQEANPALQVRMADVLRLAVQSTTAALAAGRLPVANSLPPLRLTGDRDEAA